MALIMAEDEAQVNSSYEVFLIIVPTKKCLEKGSSSSVTTLNLFNSMVYKDFWSTWTKNNEQLI